MPPLLQQCMCLSKRRMDWVNAAHQTEHHTSGKEEANTKSLERGSKTWKVIGRIICISFKALPHVHRPWPAAMHQRLMEFWLKPVGSKVKQVVTEKSLQWCLCFYVLIWKCIPVLTCSSFFPLCFFSAACSRHFILSYLPPLSVKEAHWSGNLLKF